ncbi:MAG: DUF1501 domain-containing protein [bacterium]|nr:DUF1501 domain-containing protein [bacterium]
MTNFDRRQFLRVGGAGALFSGLLSAGTRSPMSVVARLSGSPMPVTTPRVFTIFLRGAMDGVHTVIPKNDPTYLTARFSPEMRPTTAPLAGSTFAELNTDFDLLQDIHNSNNAAFVHQVGNPEGERSHFVEQQIWESAFVPTVAQPSLEEEGVIARLAEAAGFGSDVPGASVSKAMQRFYRGFTPARILAHIRSLSDYSIGAAGGIADRQRDALARNLMTTPTKELERFLDATGEFVLASEDAVSGLAGYQHDGAKFPIGEPEATAAGLDYYQPGDAFMRQCEEGVELLLAAGGPVDCQAVGVEFGGWDTHVDQDEQRPLLDPYLARAIRSIYDCALPACPNFVILVVTEFGRTNFENSRTGTDHGVGSLLMAFGPRVNGGVYNCHDGIGLGRQWRNLGNTPQDYTLWPNAQPVATDFRLIYAEMFEKLFGLTSGAGSQIEQVVPGWTDSNYLGVFN